MTTPDSPGTEERKQELEENAKIAYTEVSTQEELLNGGKNPTGDQKATINEKDKPDADSELDEALDEAAQDSNIGGG